MTDLVDPGLSPDVEAVQGASANEPGQPTGLVTESDAQRLRQVLVARYGPELGAEAWQDTVAYSWQHRDRLADMTNPVGYLYRVAQTSVRRQRRWSRRVELLAVDPVHLPDVEPGLPAALASLSSRQRTVVLLVHAHGWTQQEAADVLGMDVSTLRNHLRRGMTRLRQKLGVDDDA